MRGRAWAATAVALLAGGVAAAHTRSESHALWEVDGSHVDLVLTLPAAEIARLGANGAPADDGVVIDYLTARVYPLAGGRRCALVPPVQSPAALPGFRKFDFTFRCPSAADLAVHSAAFIDRVPEHVQFAQLQNVVSGEFVEQLLTRDRQTVEVTDSAGSRLRTAGLAEFVRMGMLHIFSGVDHLAFLLGLMLISRRLKDLIFVVTGFTVGHSLTLALAVTGVLRPHAEYIDALVALTIALIGAENVAVQTHRPLPVAVTVTAALLLMAAAGALGGGGLPVPLLLGAALFSGSYLLMSGSLVDAGRLRVLITLVFGLIHGFGFAADLLELQLPPQRLGTLLFGFNLGVECGQVAVVTGVTLAVA